jgi:hypothetical protein
VPSLEIICINNKNISGANMPKKRELPRSINLLGVDAMHFKYLKIDL